MCQKQLGDKCLLTSEPPLIKDTYMKYRSSKISWVFGLILLPVLINITFQISYALMNAGYGKRPQISSHILSFVMFYCVYLMLLSLFKNSKTAAIPISAFLVLLLIVNQFKIHYTMEPVLFTDILLLNDTGSLAEIMGDTFLSTFVSMLPSMLLITAVFVGICVLANIFNLSFGNNKARIGATSASVIILLVLFIPNPFMTRLMNKTFFEVIAEKDNHTTSNIAYYNKHGFFAGLYGQLISNRFVRPDDYEECISQIEKELAVLENTPCSGEWKDPNVIMIFSESFWDIDNMEDIHFDKPVTSNFNALKEKGIFFDMISPSYGGISANVEFEMLTGSSIKYYGSGYIPYMQLMTSDYYYNTPSVIGVFNDNGYDTTIASTWSDKLFNCKNVYEYFGVKNTIYNTDMEDAELKGGRISEKYVADRIMKYMDNKKKGTPAFYMFLTAQTHMPYPKDRYSEDEYDIEITSKGDISDFAADSLRCYAQGVYDADKQLGRLYEYIQTLEEPTILIFYGDHLPYINEEDGTDAYPSFAHFNTGDSLTDTFRKYNTQCLILANFDLGEDNIKILGPNLVMPYVLSRTNLKVPAYFKWLAERKDGLCAGNTLVYSDAKGNLYTADTLPDDLKEDLHRQECFNWRYFVEGR